MYRKAIFVGGSSPHKMQGFTIQTWRTWDLPITIATTGFESKNDGFFYRILTIKLSEINPTFRSPYLVVYIG